MPSSVLGVQPRRRRQRRRRPDQQERGSEQDGEQFPPEGHRRRLSPCRRAERNRDFAATGGLPTLDHPMARMSRLIAVLLAAAALLPAAAQAAGPSATRSALASQMRFAGGGSGALAVDLDSGRQIFASRPDTPRMPASVNKLFTTSTALSLYGVDGPPDHPRAGRRRRRPRRAC